MRTLLLLLFGLILIAMLSYLAFKMKGRDIQKQRNSALLAVTDTDKRAKRIEEKYIIEKNQTTEYNETTKNKKHLTLAPSTLSKKAPNTILGDTNLSKTQNIKNNKRSCQNQITALLHKSKIEFTVNTSQLQKKSHRILKTLIESIKSCQVPKIIIIGHTDSMGKRTYNQQLSLQRANTVKKYFIQQGILKNKIETRGYGEKKPIADNRTKEGREKNRRIQILIQGKKS
jgi:outer membrane protein OmpA-like peptidoglycan-associated protein